MIFRIVGSGLLLVFAYLISGCGGSDENSSGNTQVTTTQSADELYSSMCSACHGTSGEGAGTNPALANKFIDIPSLQAIIDQRMPANDPGACIDTCARDLAEFIISGLGIPQSAGTVTLHRLNRVEYNNTVRDLLLTNETPAADFPSDDFGYGFDNIANVLSLSPLHVELLEDSASRLANEAAIRVPYDQISVLTEAETLTGTSGATGAGAWNLFSNGSITELFQIPVSGDYEFTARVWGTQGGTELVKMDLRLDGISIMTVDVPNEQNNPGNYTITANLPAGATEFSVAFLNDFYDATAGVDRNLLVDWLQVEGPFNVTPPDNTYRARLYICDPLITGVRSCAQEIITNFTRQAWRRPVTTTEVDELLLIFNTALDQGDDFDSGIALAMRATLLSPHFIFRVELDPTNTNPHPLSAHELASRLSYFLWSSMPDAELTSLADNGQLLEKSVIASQVSRMLADPRAKALVDNFAGQWLQTRGLSNVEPDYSLFPGWDNTLRQSLKTETETFFDYLIHTRVSMQELITANYSFLDTRLANYYGVPVPVTEFEKTDLPADRIGYLTQGGFLTVSSYPTRTSIVKRGKWILSNLLCSEPPPPPPGVEGLPVTETPTGSLREIMESHRSNPVCASCHEAMDPIGFSLEHYDAIGNWRELDNGFPIDDTGQLPDGTTFNGATGLAQVIVDDPRYSVCVVQKLFTYALGRGPTAADTSYLSAINSAWITQGMEFSQLATLIAQSDPFTTRHSEGVE